MKFTVPQELDGITVQNFLRKHCFVSARMLTKLKRVENGITLDGKLIRSIDILHGGDTVKLILPKESVHIEPVNLPLDIVYEDEWLIVYNKPPFMPVHPVRDHQLERPFMRQRWERTIHFMQLTDWTKIHQAWCLRQKTPTVHRFFQTIQKSTILHFVRGKLQVAEQ